MEEYKKGEQTWMQKYGALVVPIVVIVVSGMLMIMAMDFAKKTYVEGVEAATGQLTEVSKNMNWWQNEDVLEKVADKVNQKQDEADNPPT